MKKQVLITGGTGYIGSHTAVEFIEAGYEVLIIDNLSNSKIDSLDGIEKITGTKPEFAQFDLTDKLKLNDFFEAHPNIEAIIHFAAYKAVGESVAKPMMYYQNNLGSLMNLLEMTKKYKTKSFVFSSSCTVYGEPEELPVKENSPVQEATSPYGNTKQIAEEIIRDFMKVEQDLKSIALRYFNPVGAHESAEIGELPLGVPNNLVPFITQTAIGIRKELSVFGFDYDTPDGTCIRDYIHVVDLAKAHVIATERLLNNKNKSNYEMFNLGTGTGNSVLEVIKSFEKMSKQKLNYKLVDRRPGDVVKVYSDTEFANNELGWKTEKNLDDMMLSAWNWENNLKNK
ncbi:MAG: UDP-glucose 4-epimerase GalE [Bacteroidetes bacterium 4572_117]|nr:MAG: UDP-glucose 4-epimerase GalE [Bacteroidetes bacterium 4572_117]